MPTRKNPLKGDPTRTVFLRKRFEGELVKRFRKVRRDIATLLVEEDAFGIIEDRKVEERFPSNNESPTINTRWRFQTDPQKIELFMLWLAEEFQEDVLLYGNDFLLERYIQEGFRKGAGRAFDDFRRSVPTEETPDEVRGFFAGSREEFLRQSFAVPKSVEQVKILLGRTFTDLKGVTDVTATQIRRVLSDGFVQGKHPNAIARDIAKVIDSIGIARARMIARSETIRAHAQGQLRAFEALGVVELGVMAEWSTAGDDRVCPQCEPLNGAIFTIKEAEGLIPLHPQCRCAWTPSGVGEDRRGKKRTKRQIDKAIEKSLRAGARKADRKKSIGTIKRKSLWPGAGRTIASTRPKSVLD